MAGIETVAGHTTHSLVVIRIATYDPATHQAPSDEMEVGCLEKRS